MDTSHRIAWEVRQLRSGGWIVQSEVPQGCLLLSPSGEIVGPEIWTREPPDDPGADGPEPPGVIFVEDHTFPTEALARVAMELWRLNQERLRWSFGGSVEA